LETHVDQLNGTQARSSRVASAAAPRPGLGERVERVADDDRAAHGGQPRLGLVGELRRRVGRADLGDAVSVMPSRPTLKPTAPTNQLFSVPSVWS
jgi:hypothetical protein